MKNLKSRVLKSSLVTALLFVGLSGINAQDVVQKKAEFGVRAMPTISSLDMQTSSGGTVSGSASIGFGAGVFLGFNFTNHVGIQAELIYSSISQKSYDANIERRVNLRYVNVPLLLSLNTNKSKLVNLNLVVGPQLGINVGSRVTQSGPTDINNPQPVLSVRKSDIGFAYGAGLDFGLNPMRTMRVGLGYRGVYGLIDISKQGQTTATESYYLLDRTKIQTHSAYLSFSIMF